MRTWSSWINWQINCSKLFCFIFSIRAIPKHTHHQSLYTSDNNRWNNTCNNLCDQGRGSSNLQNPVYIYQCFFQFLTLYHITKTGLGIRKGNTNSNLVNCFNVSPSMSDINLDRFGPSLNFKNLSLRVLHEQQHYIVSKGPVIFLT